MIPKNFHYFSITELEKTFNLEFPINIDIIRRACSMANILCFGGGTGFTIPDNRYENETEIEQLHRTLLRNLESEIIDRIVLYERLIKPNTTYIYYTVISFVGTDMKDIKRALKTYKMKAFL